MSISIVPVERGEIYPAQREFKQWGITARNFSFLLAREMKRTNLDGVLVTSVRPGGPAGQAKPSLERGDVLVEIDGGRSNRSGTWRSGRGCCRKGRPSLCR
jgi:S1-C subfamily serine protease